MHAVGVTVGYSEYEKYLVRLTITLPSPCLHYALCHAWSTSACRIYRQPVRRRALGSRRRPAWTPAAAERSPTYPAPRIAQFTIACSESFGPSRPRFSSLSSPSSFAARLLQSLRKGKLFHFWKLIIHFGIIIMGKNRWPKIEPLIVGIGAVFNW